MENRKSQISIIFLFILLIITSIVAVYFFNGNLVAVTSNIVLDFPPSNSSILSTINNTFEANEKVVVNAFFKDKPIIEELYINIDGKNISFEENNNGINFSLDTLIRNGEDQETKVIMIHGRTMKGSPFTDEENYYIISPIQGLSIEDLKDTKKRDDYSNKTNLGLLITTIVLILLNLIQFILNKKEKNKKSFHPIKISINRNK